MKQGFSLIEPKQQGFSLIEMLIALAMLIIVVTAVSLLPAMNLGRQNDTRTYASNIAREVIDAYRAEWLDRTAFRNGTAPTLPTGLRYGCSIAAPTVTAYTVNGSYQLEVTASTPSVRKVQVNVTCPKGNISLSTFVGDPAPAEAS
jgi:prepilin-type N-terminal cleavage/methylation domain-containing protein